MVKKKMPKKKKIRSGEKLLGTGMARKAAKAIKSRKKRLLEY